MTGRMRAVTMAIALALVACTSDPTTPTAPTPTPQGPSQTPEEARRDGVPGDVAALTLSERADRPEPADASITSDEGVWAIARPPTSTPDYGEVLLLDARREHIIKAFPLPGTPAYQLAITERAVYCGRQGDGGLPNTTLCRIDRRSRKLLVRVFTETDDLELYELDADDAAVWAKDSKGTWTRLDPTTLDVVEREVARPTAAPS